MAQVIQGHIPREVLIKGHFKLRSEDIMDDDDEKSLSGLLTED